MGDAGVFTCQVLSHLSYQAHSGLDRTRTCNHLVPQKEVANICDARHCVLLNMTPGNRRRWREKSKLCGLLPASRFELEINDFQSFALSEVATDYRRRDVCASAAGNWALRVARQGGANGVEPFRKIFSRDIHYRRNPLAIGAAALAVFHCHSDGKWHRTYGVGSIPKIEVTPCFRRA